MKPTGEPKVTRLDVIKGTLVDKSHEPRYWRLGVEKPGMRLTVPAFAPGMPEWGRQFQGQSFEVVLIPTGKLSISGLRIDTTTIPVADIPDGMWFRVTSYPSGEAVSKAE